MKWIAVCLFHISHIFKLQIVSIRMQQTDILHEWLKIRAVSFVGCTLNMCDRVQQ